jgi:hypothetical protein
MMADSLKSTFLRQEERNKNIEYFSDYDSEEIAPEHFGVGGLTEKVLEEIHEEQDEWEIFFTTMFFLGIVLIPLQLIFADDIKPYEADIIIALQNNVVYLNESTTMIFAVVTSVFSTLSNIRFLTSFVVFFYLCFDPGVAYKTTLVAGFGIYIVFILKLIIHDSRPFWIYDTIRPGLCRTSFGSPSLDVFVGMLYANYMLFSTKRALQSKDRIVALNRTAIVASEYCSIGLIVSNLGVGFMYWTMGENFFYQIIVSFFYGFVLIRITIIFNKDIDHFANGSRFVKQISNVSNIMVMFFVTTLAILACIIYEITNSDLLISRDWTTNIAVR